jgi:hypothetical protein
MIRYGRAMTELAINRGGVRTGGLRELSISCHR